MLIKKPEDIKGSEITPKSIYAQRRKFLQGAGTLAAGSLLPSLSLGQAGSALKAPAPAGLSSSPVPAWLQAKLGGATGAPDSEPFFTDEELTPFGDVTRYNNFYEFGYTKNIKAEALAQIDFFEDENWEIEISGLVANPMTINVWDLIDMMQLEERLYRHRCVEAWSIVQPVTGFPVTKLLDLVQPLESAKYIKFQTFYDTDVSLVQELDNRWPWPYVPTNCALL